VFSNRLPQDLAANRLASALSQMRRDGRAFVDLTESNPTQAKFTYPPDLLAALSDPRALDYRPAPLGSPAARRAVSDRLPAPGPLRSARPRGPDCEHERGLTRCCSSC